MLFLYCFFATSIFAPYFSFFQLPLSLFLFHLIRKSSKLRWNIDFARGTDSLISEDSPWNRSHIVASLIFNSKIKGESVQAHFKANLRKFPQYDKLMKTIRSRFLLYYWSPVDNFSLENHFETIKEEVSKDELTAFMSKHTSEIEFEPGKPKWKVFIFDSLQNNQSAVVLKIHHSIGDGASIMSLMLNLGSCTQFNEVSLPKLSNAAWFLSLPLGLYHTIKLLVYLITDAIFTLRRKSNFTAPLLSGQKSGFLSKSFPITLLKAISHAENRATFNELIFTIFNRSLNEVHLNKYGRRIENFPFLIAASLRSFPKPGFPLELTNFTNFMRMIPFPHGSCREVLAQYHDLARKIRKNFDFYYYQFFTDALSQLFPLFIAQWIMNRFFKVYPFILTSVPGPLQTIKVYEQEVDDIRFLANSPGDSSAVFNVFSYNGNVNFGCFADVNTGINANDVVEEIEKFFSESRK